MSINIKAELNPFSGAKPSEDFLADVAILFSQQGQLMNQVLGQKMEGMQEKDDEQTVNLGVTTAARALLNKMAADAKTTDQPAWYSDEGDALRDALQKLPGGHEMWESLHDKGDVENLAAKFDAKSQVFTTQSQQDQFKLSQSAQQLAALYQNASTFISKDASTSTTIIGNVNR